MVQACLTNIHLFMMYFIPSKLGFGKKLISLEPEWSNELMRIRGEYHLVKWKTCCKSKDLVDWDCQFGYHEQSPDG